ncbi:TIR domain-containing protein [Halodesulfovibrio aestuarii]|uniref:TIR domain-containing protein n=1 Tax=Halodesulfovibrio aestuarii TaxID=126333 RepID=A0A8G2C7Z3_9BACT|nr:toll/interleukin-1 receptor domain-containing protein [Halodesulfovibrio aestuarii]SHI72980.1 TIR domain-containing protein [Halodesulfovibrio aestuarii]
MPTCFLSHSSKDKAHFVSLVSDRLKSHFHVVDEKSFEEGEKSIDEIIKNLDRTDIFVLFISNDSLESTWVLTEITEAKDRLDKHELKKFYPIIIDTNVTYYDKRLPDWLREYNLKPVLKVAAVVRRIEKKIREVSWEQHPQLKARKKIFIGRNEHIQKFEERYADYDQGTPICFIASGIKKIGRKSFLTHCFEKVSFFDESYKPALIELQQDESIEDFILKIYDLGFTEHIETRNLMKTPIEKKVNIAFSLMKDVQRIKEVVMINDNGCLVTREGRFTDWFDSLLTKLSQHTDRATFIIASRTTVKNFFYRTRGEIFSIFIPELEQKERAGLFRRYLDLYNLELTREDFNLFSSLQKGYPDQVAFTVDLIRELGVPNLKRDTKKIVDYNSELVNITIQEYNENKKAIGLLAFFSKFDFVSYKLADDIIGKDEESYLLLNEFTNTGACVQMGVNGEFFRINDMLRDYVQRTRYEIPSQFEKAMKQHVENSLANYEDDFDLSDHLSTIKEGLIQKKIAPSDSRIIPSILIKTMRDLYHHSKAYGDVISFANKFLENEQYLDRNIVYEAKFFLCLSYSRTRNDKALKIAHQFPAPELNFLKGFYYRNAERYADALEQYKKALAITPSFSRAQRELVNVYIKLEDYDLALNLAKQGYNNNKKNIYLAQAYFNCLVRNLNPTHLANKKEILLEIISSLESNVSEKAKEMSYSARALYSFYIEQDYTRALNTVAEAMILLPHNIYPIMTKFDLAEKSSDLSTMEKALKELQSIITSSSRFVAPIAKMEASIAYKKGDSELALHILSKKLGNYPADSLERIKRRLMNGTLSGDNVGPK